MPQGSPLHAEALTGYSNKKAIIKNSKWSVDNGKREKA